MDTQEERGHKINREEEKDDDDTFRYNVLDREETYLTALVCNA